MKLGKHKIVEGGMPYIIAEVGVNHEGSLEQAKLMIKQAHDAGAHGVKFQTYKADKIASKHSPAYWDLTMEPTTSQFELFKKHDSFNASDYLECKRFSEEIGIDFLSTPFDLDALAFINDLVPFHKVSSSDITNIPFLRAVGATQKPVVLSTGASDYNEIEIAIEQLELSGATDVIILHCILNYPTPYQNANLNMIKGLRARFPNYLIGLSDHTLADEKMLSVTAAYCLGCSVIEKHFTFDKSVKGSDHRHSMDASDLNELVENLEFVSTLFGETERKVLKEEEVSRVNARRSIVAARSIDAGAILTPEMLICKRPALGIPASDWDKVIGCKLKSSVEIDQLLSWDDLE